MLDEGFEKKWRSSSKLKVEYARGHGYCTSKADLLRKLTFANLLRTEALIPTTSPSWPYVLPLRIADNTGEEYLVESLRPHVTLIATTNMDGVEDKEDFVKPSWLLKTGTKGVVLDTLFTRDSKWGKVDEPRGMIALYST